MCDQDRGALPFQLIQGEALVTVASWSVQQAGVSLVDQRTPWTDLAELGEPVLLHDPLCPTTPPEFLASCVEIARDRGVVVVGVRPVTDTVKQLVEGQLGATVDRDQLVGVCSPVVLPAAVVVDIAPGGLPVSDFVALTRWLRERYDVEPVQAPATARRVSSAEDLRVLAALIAR